MENKNFGNKLIKNYINGDDLGKYSIEELENNSYFMKEVIDYTNDYKIYNLCSDNLKKNYSFIKYLINKFNKNYEFIDNISSYYVDNTENELYRKELCIVLENILPDDLAEKYKLINNAGYSLDRVCVELFNLENSSIDKLISKGFIIFNEKYNDNKIIFNYYLKNLMKEIIKEDNNFKVALLRQLEDGKRFSKTEMTNFIIEFICKYDTIFGIYISSNIDLIQDVVKEAERLQNQWYKEINQIEKDRFDEMIDMVHEYLYISNSNLDEIDILFYVAKELSVSDKIENHYYLNEKVPDSEEFDYIMKDEIVSKVSRDDFDYNFIEHYINKNEKNKTDYLNIKKIMENQLFTYNKLDVNSLIVDDNKNKQKKLLKNNQLPKERNND